MQCRKNNRLSNFDYSKNGCYFITICVKDRKNILSQIVGDGVLDVPTIKLSEYGKIVNDTILEMNNYYNTFTVKEYVIMPNHIHFIVEIKCSNGTSRTPSPTNSLLAQFVSTFKRFVHKKCGNQIFQRSYYDHIIRDDEDYLKISRYILENPVKFKEDKYYE